MDRRQFSGRRLVSGGALALLLSAPVVSAGEAALERELQRLAPLSGGVMGVGVVHLESGRRAFLNADEPFPMASTYKVPIAVQILHRVGEKELDLAQMVEVGRGDYSPGSGFLTDLLREPGLALSVRNLLEIMLLVSDNTATDLLLRHAGGGGAVTSRMKKLGVDGVRVDRPTFQLIADWKGLTVPAESERDPAKFGDLLDSVSEEVSAGAEEAFEADVRDTATPRGMAALLEKIWKREALSAEGTSLLLDIMSRCRTGEGRLKGVLPKGTEVAHKTGTIGRSLNDVGIVTLPNGAGHVVVAAFVKKSDSSEADRERAIAHAARAAHDYFLFTSP